MDESRAPSELAGFPAAVTSAVQWGDEDAFGHVNNTVPLRSFETSRIVYLEQSGLGRMTSGDGLGPIVASITCHYRRQNVYPDTVYVGTKLASQQHDPGPCGLSRIIQARSAGREKPRRLLRLRFRLQCAALWVILPQVLIVTSVAVKSVCFMNNPVYSRSHHALAADGQTVVVFFESDAHRPRRIPDEVRQKIEAFDQRAQSV